MTITQLTISTAASVLVGGLIPVTIFLLTEWMKQQREIAEWFEKRYIEDSIDVLQEFFGKWALLSSLPARNPQELLVNPVFAEVPTQAATRLTSIIGPLSFQNWFNAMRSFWLRTVQRGNFDELIQFHIHAATMAERLTELRTDLLEIHLKRKSDTYKLRTSTGVTKFNDSLEAMTNTLVVKWTPEAGQVAGGR